MKQKLETLLQQAVDLLKSESILEQEITPIINIEHTKDPLHGDFATNLAMVLAKSAKTSPRQLAEKIISLIPEDSIVAKVEIAGPGFINFLLTAMLNLTLLNKSIKQLVNLG